MSLKTPIISDIKKYLGMDDFRYISKEMKGNIAQMNELFEHAKEEILIRAGELNSEFYNNITPILDAALERNENLHVKIIFGPKMDVKNEKFVKLIAKSKNKDRIELRWDGYRDPPHYVLSNSKYIRLEKEHLALSPIEYRKGGVIGRSGFSGLAKKYKKHFDKLYGEREPFDIIEELMKAKPLKEEEVDKDGVFGFITYRETAKGYSAPATQNQIDKLKEIAT